MAKVVIIGAGIAGLSAAVELAKHHQVIVIEARNRLGGRIYSHTVDESNLEIGASFWEGKKNNPFYLQYFAQTKTTKKPLALRLNEKLCIVKSDKPIKPAEFTSYYQMASLFANQFCQTHIGQHGEQLINQLPITGDEHKQYWVRKFFELQFQHFNTDLKERGVPYFTIPFDEEQLEAWDEENADFCVVANGYHKVIEQLAKEAKKLNVKIKLNSPIIRIVQSPKGVILKTATEYFQADKVVSTIPIGVLKNTAPTLFEPSLSEEKLQALKTIGVHNGIRVSLIFQGAPFWSPIDAPMIFIDLPNKPLREFRNAYITSGKTILQTDKYSDICRHFFNIFPDSQQDAENEIVKHIMGDLKYALPSNEIPWPQTVSIYDWTLDPFAQGAYPYRTILQTEELQTALECKEGHVYFAGSDFSRLGFSVHNGFANAKHVAKDLMQDLENESVNSLTNMAL